MTNNKGVLILTPFFSPNVGGVETYLDDLVVALDKRDYNVYVKSYSPITTQAEWKSQERRGKNIHIQRYKWFGKDLFHKIENNPLLDFLYLTPYLFLRTLIYLIFNHSKIDIVHAQGINAGFICALLRPFFSRRKKWFMTIHAVYEFPAHSSTAKIMKWVSSRMDHIFCDSKSIEAGMLSYGIPAEHSDVALLWIDMDQFVVKEKRDAKKEVGITDKFTVVFVGRLIEKKGTDVLLQVALQSPETEFIFIGDGPLKQKLAEADKQHSNIHFLGKIENTKLPMYLQASDLLCIPSLYEEGYGRVVMEALACGTPVIGSNRGGIGEAAGPEVAILVEPTQENFVKVLQDLQNNPELYSRMQKNARPFAEKTHSEENVNVITDWYEKEKGRS